MVTGVRQTTVTRIPVAVEETVAVVVRIQAITIAGVTEATRANTASSTLVKVKLASHVGYRVPHYKSEFSKLIVRMIQS